MYFHLDDYKSPLLDIFFMLMSSFVRHGIRNLSASHYRPHFCAQTNNYMFLFHTRFSFIKMPWQHKMRTEWSRSVCSLCVWVCLCVCHQVSCSYFDNNYHFNVTHFPPLWPIEKENCSSDVSGLAEYIHIFNISASKTGHLNLVLCVVAVHAHVNVGNVIPCHKLTWKECDPEKIHHLL